MVIITTCLLVLFTLTSIAQTGATKSITDNIPEFFSGDEEIRKAVAHIEELINENRVVVSREIEENTYHQWGSGNNIQVFNDRIEIRKGNFNVSYFFKDIIKSVLFTKDMQGNVRVYIGEFDIYIKGEGNGQKFKDDILFIEKHNEKLRTEKIAEEQKAQLLIFEPIAAQYRALKVKPPVSEEQRKYIVQANSFNQKKDFIRAIELYSKAIEIEQTAYPAAYSNLALLSAQVNKYNDAIFYMKKYLLLEPDATDSRGARDKIYEWEIEAVK